MAKSSSKRTAKTQDGGILSAIREPEWVKEALNSNVVREALAAALLAGAAAAAAVLTGRGGEAVKAVKSGASGALKTAADAGGVARTFAQQAAGAVAGIAVDAAHDLVLGSSRAADNEDAAAPGRTGASGKAQRPPAAGKKTAGGKRRK